MKIKEIREHTDDQLLVELGALQKRIFELRTQAVTEKSKATSEIHKSRKDIARIKTVMHQRQLQAAQAKVAQEVGR